MTKRIAILPVLLMLFSLLALAAPASYAQGGVGETNTPVTPATGPDGKVEVNLTALGYSERRLKGPYDSATYYFSLPAHWQPTTETQVQLDIDVWGLTDTTTVTGTNHAALEIYVNSDRLDTVPLEQNGRRILTLSIPPAAFGAPQENGRHRLRVLLDDDQSCNTNYPSNVLIDPGSKLILPYHTIPLTADLTRLPFPIFQRSFLPEGAIIVVPNAPSAAELQAALAVAAGFGRMTEGELPLTLATEDQLTRDERQSRHLILVGKPDTLTLPGEIAFPENASTAGFGQSIAQADDGVIQMAASPWNAAKAVLWVSGADDAGVIKAGQAVSSGLIRVAGRPDFAVVQQVNPGVLANSRGTVDRTLAELGYNLTSLEGEGHSSADFVFQIPAGQAPADGIYFDLFFSHSTLIDYQRSGVGINVNGEPVGSVRLSDETANFHSTRIAIPRTAVHTGANYLSVEGWFEPVSKCFQFNNEGVWLAVRPESNLHLPQTALTDVPANTFTLSEFPVPFSRDFTLSDTAFVLPANDPAAWQTAAQLAFTLGQEAGARVANFTVSLDDLAAVETTYHTLIVGQPGGLTAISELGQALPAPYEPDTNEISQVNLPFVYRVPEGESMGVLQLLSAPANPRQTIVAVLGNSAEGVQLAANALINKDQREKLLGDVAVIDSTQVLVANTRPAPVAQAALTEPPQTTVAADTPAVVQVNLASVAQPVSSFSANQQFSVGRFNTWMMPVLAVSIAAMVIIVLYVSFSELRKRRAH